jgi:hypothetical protein
MTPSLVCDFKCAATRCLFAKSDIFIVPFTSGQRENKKTAGCGGSMYPAIALSNAYEVS